MVHLISIAVSFSLLVGLAMLLERMFREHGSAIRAALFGARTGAAASDGALGRIGACLRASFPTVDEKAFDPALSRLLLNLSESPRGRAAGPAR